jgi:hypothetical protein
MSTKISTIVEKLAAEFIRAGLSNKQIEQIGVRLQLFIRVMENAKRNEF